MDYHKIKQICGDTKIVAVSKYVDENAIKALYDKGQIDFGENKVQDLVLKKQALPDNINWHFIGNLQKNKINHLINAKPCMWQSCVSYELAKEVDKRLDYKLDTLFEINVANELSKQGCDKNKAIDEYLKIKQDCKNINLIGVMSIGAMSDDELVVAKSFEDTKDIFDKLIPYGAKWCSMGMSGDFELAIKCGSNMVRLGSILFKGN